jgi:hypothetical protein
MKKMISVVVFGLVLASVQIMAQTKPFIGYDKVAWGVSVADLRKVYSIGDDIVVEASDDPNIVWLRQEQVSDSIAKRSFAFNGDKLYRVVVTYKNGSDATQSQLKGLLEQRYGSSTGIDFQSGDSGNLFVSIPYNDTITIFGKFSPEIEVQLIQRKYGYSTGFSPDIYVYYTWKKFRDEYQASKLGL